MYVCYVVRLRSHMLLLKVELHVLYGWMSRCNRQGRGLPNGMGGDLYSFFLSFSAFFVPILASWGF
jgi:hypothetical protein